MQVDIEGGPAIGDNGGNQDGLVRPPAGREDDVGNAKRPDGTRRARCRVIIVIPTVKGCGIFPVAGGISGNRAAEKPRVAARVYTADGDIPLVRRFVGDGEVSDPVVGGAIVEGKAAIRNFANVKILSKYFGDNPKPGRIQRKFFSVNISPDFKSFVT